MLRIKAGSRYLRQVFIFLRADLARGAFWSPIILSGQGEVVWFEVLLISPVLHEKVDTFLMFGPTDSGKSQIMPFTKSLEKETRENGKRTKMQHPPQQL